MEQAIGLIGSLAALLIALGGIFVLLLRNSANAQSILNKNYDAMGVRVNALEKDKETLIASLAARDVVHAEERGGLNQKILVLEKLMAEERTNSTARSSDNAAQIESLKTDLAVMKRDQTVLEARVEVITHERDSLKEQLIAVQAELVKVHEREQQLQAEIVRLMGELAKRETELLDLHRQLDGTP